MQELGGSGATSDLTTKDNSGSSQACATVPIRSLSSLARGISPSASSPPCQSLPVPPRIAPASLRQQVPCSSNPLKPLPPRGLRSVGAVTYPVAFRVSSLRA